MGILLLVLFNIVLQFLVHSSQGCASTGEVKLLHYENCEPIIVYSHAVFNESFPASNALNPDCDAHWLQRSNATGEGFIVDTNCRDEITELSIWLRNIEISTFAEERYQVFGYSAT